MKKHWVGCACFGMAVACAANRSPSGSEEAELRRTPSQLTAALLGDGISSEVLLDNPVSMPLAPGALSISADPNGFLVTWFDGREGHSGQSTYVGEVDHVVAALVSNSGVVANPSDLILSTGTILESGMATDRARSAFNGQYYLVAWHKLMQTTTVAFGPDVTVPSEIDAVRISTTGEILDATPLVLSALAAGDLSTVDVLLSNAGGFFVAWSGQTSTAPGPVQSLTLSFAGSTPVLGPVTTYPFLGGDPTKYAFAYDGLGYAAASVKPGNSGFTVGALSHLATSDCAATGSSIDAVGLGSNGAGELLVAYAGHVLTTGGACTVGTKVVQIGTDGLQKAPPLVLPITPVIIPPLTVAYSAGKYFVAGFQIDPATNVATPATTGAPSTLACNASTCLTAVGTGVSRVSSTGVRLDDPPIVVSAPARAETAPHVVAGAGEYLALWTEDNGGDNRDTLLHAGRLSSTGASLDPTPALIAQNSFFIRVQFNGTDFVVLWMDGTAGNYSLHLTRISPTGVVKDPAGIAIATLDGSFVNVALACAATECLVAWSATDYSSPPSPVAASATRIAANGTLLDSPPFQVLADAQPSMLKYTGSGYLMQFHSSTLIDGLQLLDTTGHAVGAPMPGNPQTLYPCGSNYVTFTTVPYDNWLKYAVALLDSSATVLQPNVDLGGVAEAQANLPGVASTATGCVIAWSQLSGDNQDVYANMINGDGTVALSSPLPIATDHGFNEFGPALAVGADGKILAAYTHFVAQAPYGNLRTAARLIDPSAFAPGASGEGGEGGGAGSLPTGGATNTAGSADSPGGGSTTTGGTANAGGVGGNAASGASTGGVGASTASGGSLATGGTAGQSGAGGNPSGEAASGGTTHGGAGASGIGGTGADSGHGSGGNGCAMSRRRAPLRTALPIAFMLFAFSGWRRSRKSNR